MKRLVTVAAVAAVMLGCASSYERSADRETLPIVRDLNAKVDKQRVQETPEGVITPKPQGAEAEMASIVKKEEAPELLALVDCLKLAFSTSRQFKFEKESLYLSALSFTGTRHNFEWRPSATLSGEAATDSNSADATGDATLALTRRLLSGGDFSISATASQTGRLTGAGGNSNGTDASMRFSQPLLSGAGEAAREQLVQAGRSLMYDARDFELFRQQLVIDIVSQYYGLLRQRRRVETAQANAKRLTFLYDRSSQLFEKGKGTLVDELRALQEKLSSESRLNDEQATYSLDLDRFKISLGLATDKNVDVADETLEPEIITVDLEAAVKTALGNRLDLMTAHDRLADSDRKVRVARNGLLPELEFFANANIGSRTGRDFLDFSASEDGSASAGVTLSLPVDKKSERNAYKSSLISYDREQRTYQLAEDNVKLNVRDTVRNLRQAEVGIAIQSQNVTQALKRVEAAQILFEKGSYGTRELVDAETALQDAQNAYVDARVNYLIASIQLKRDIGTLRVDELGGWR